MVSFLESSGLVGLSSRLVMVLKSSTGCVSTLVTENRGTLPFFDSLF